jgi:hypothetical protein
VSFKRGQKLYVVESDGTEKAVIFQQEASVNTAWVIIESSNATVSVQIKDLLRPKQPGFKVRDLAFVIYEANQAVQGEIIGIGNGPKGKKFYELKFPDNRTKWCSEDEIFNLDESRGLNISEDAIRNAQERS